MTDKKPDVDEFNFDEKTEKSNVLDQSMTTSRTGSNPNPVGVVVAVVFFAVLVYFFSGSSSSTSKPTDPKKVMTEAQSVSKPAPPKLSKEMEIDVMPEKKDSDSAEKVPEITSADHKPLSKAHSDEYWKALESLESVLKHLYERQADISAQLHHHSVENQAMIKKNHAELRSLIAEVAAQSKELKAQQAHFEKNLDTVVQKITQSNEAMKNIEKIMRVQVQEFQVSTHDLTQPIPTPKYIVHAVIPGRAWLKNGNQIFSVTEGQEIEPYGKILTIDARLGTIVTASGQVLRYS